MILFNLFLLIAQTAAFTRAPASIGWPVESTTTLLSASPATASFIDSELRGAAMKLHTTQQAPKEGGVVEKKTPPKERYVPTRGDYLAFLVDSQHVFQALEDFVSNSEELSQFQDTGLERTKGLEKDIVFLTEEYNLERPAPSEKGEWYANYITSLSSVPKFMCHYYNFYFAHTAGGLMIGKQMAKLLLDSRTLEFYKWEGDIKELKESVKNDIESMAATWSREEKDECVSETANAFRGGGGVNSNLNGGGSSH
eukprot:CAMPEP_0178930316 /NCGR_PEP_ID=MMETSP0786-20121207/21152_1 /TAXON_ID=186022 /ORGANISM="Thalassionema frauenfeldii, Strain CCMP 1798" /LENGTH=253 /DNA_ID=CAMNT_0020606799 /DNA_START=54 /DNA_END=815 /DNA_ORIENTATION=-